MSEHLFFSWKWLLFEYGPRTREDQVFTLEGAKENQPEEVSLDEFVKDLESQGFKGIFEIFSRKLAYQKFFKISIVYIWVDKENHKKPSSRWRKGPS